MSLDFFGAHLNVFMSFSTDPEFRAGPKSPNLWDKMGETMPEHLRKKEFLKKLVDSRLKRVSYSTYTNGWL